MIRKLIATGILLVVVGGQALAANDPGFARQWALARIQAEPAWATSMGAGVVVAVIDTGVELSHPDLSANAHGSVNCTTDPCTLGGVDDNGHGTEVGGIIAAQANNGVGVASVAPQSRIMSVKVLDANGSGRLSDVIRGIEYGANNGARVINLSLAGEAGNILDMVCVLITVCESTAAQKERFQNAVNYAADKGALVVAAAGNDGLASFYAGMQNVHVVGATGPDDQNAPYSSTGYEMLAPGGASSGGCSVEACVLTTTNGGRYAAVQGTSFAAPHVSGVAALLMQLGLSGPQAIAKINETADTVPGGKRVNAARAVGATAPPSAPPPAPPPAPPSPLGGAPASPGAPVVAPPALPLPPVDSLIPPLPTLVLGSASQPRSLGGSSGVEAKQMGDLKDVADKSVAAGAALLVLLAAGGNAAYFVARRRWI